MPDSNHAGNSTESAEFSRGFLGGLAARIQDVEMVTATLALAVLAIASVQVYMLWKGRTH